MRSIGLPRDLGTIIHPVRLAKFAREGAVAPLTLLNDFGERRRIATLAAQLSELETTLTDAAIALFERLAAQLFTRSRARIAATARNVRPPATADPRSPDRPAPRSRRATRAAGPSRSPRRARRTDRDPAHGRAVRTRMWHVLQNWWATLQKGAVVIVWRDVRAVGKLRLKTLGEPPKEIVDADGVLLVKRR